MKENEHSMSVTRAIDIKRPSQKIKYLSVGVTGWITIRGDTVDDLALKVQELSDDKFFDSIGSLDEMLQTECIYFSDAITGKIEGRIEVSGVDVTTEYRKDVKPPVNASQGTADDNDIYLKKLGFTSKTWPDGGVSYSKKVPDGYLNASKKKDGSGWAMYINRTEGGKEYWNTNWCEEWQDIYGKLNGRDF